MNSMEPPGSAEMSQIATNLCGSFGEPKNEEWKRKFKCLFYLINIPLESAAIHGWFEGDSKDFASGIVINRGVSGDQ